MYFVRTPWLVRKLFPSITWSVLTERKEIFLTFDDGPIPEVTPWVIEILKRYNAKATFFCIGSNIEKNSDIFKQVISEGHRIGNHTFHHLNGWKTPVKKYLDDIALCEKTINQQFNNSTIQQFFPFRPPYGKITPSQISNLPAEFKSAQWQAGLKSQIYLWDVLSGDFDKEISGEQCYHNVISNAHKGSIIVFHDSLKAEKRLRYALPKVLEYFSERGYVFSVLRQR